MDTCSRKAMPCGANSANVTKVSTSPMKSHKLIEIVPLGAHKLPNCKICLPKASNATRATQTEKIPSLAAESKLLRVESSYFK